MSERFTKDTIYNQKYKECTKTSHIRHIRKHTFNHIKLGKSRKRRTSKKRDESLTRTKK